MKFKTKKSDIMRWIILISWSAAAFCSLWVDKNSHFSTRAMANIIAITAISLALGMLCIFVEVNANVKEKVQKLLTRLENICVGIFALTFFMSAPFAIATFVTATTDTNIMDIVTAICVMVMFVGSIMLLIFRSSEKKNETAVATTKPEEPSTVEQSVNQQQETTNE